METLQQAPWKLSPKNMNNQLHTMCSYMAMFPPCVPNHFIQKYSKIGDTVLDPFSGRGTTVLEACILGRIGIGNDKNPLAYSLTLSKVKVPQKGRIISRLNKLEQKFKPNKIDISKEDKNIRMIFGDYTLRQLIYLKKELNWRRSNVDTFITSMILGIMQGKTEGYLSLSMPNTFSMSPNYIRKFIAEHKLRRPKRDVFKLLRLKLERCYQRPKTEGKAYNQDVRKMTKIKSQSVNLIVTSPPYTRVISYGRFNWIRLWFLNKTFKEVDKKLFVTQSILRYTSFMTDVLTEFKRVVKPEGTIVLVIGDVRDRTNEKIYNLADIVWRNCAAPLGYEKKEEYEDVIIKNTDTKNPKVSRIWGEKKGNATKIDRIIVLRKSNGIENPDPKLTKQFDKFV